MKVTEQYFPVVLFVILYYHAVVAFESTDPAFILTFQK